MKEMYNKMKCILVGILIISCMSCHNSSPRHHWETHPQILSENLQKSFVNKKGEKTFPPYYGGSYMQDSMLFVIIIGDTVHSKKDLVQRCNGTNFTLLHCEKREDAIRKLLHYLYRFRTEEKNKEIIEKLQFKSSFMNTEKRISIELLTFQEESFRQVVLDSPFLDFERSILVFE